MSNKILIKKVLPLTCVLFVSAILTTVFFKPSDIFSDSPVLSDDYAMHYANCLAAKKFWLEYGKCWGYDPFLLAGFPRCALVNADNKLWELVFTVLSPVLGNGLAFNLYVLLFLVFYPALFYFSARNFGLTANQALTAAILGVLFFNLSLPRDFVLWGMVSYVIACFFSLFVLSLFYRLINTFIPANYIAFTLSGAVLFCMHILSPVHIAVPALIIYVLGAKRLSILQHFLVIISIGIVVAINSFWLIPVFEFLHYKTVRPENYEFALQIKNIFEPLNVYIRQTRGVPTHLPVLNNTLVDSLLLLCGLGGVYCRKRQGSNIFFWTFVSGIVVIFCVTFYGSHIAFFAQFQPQRFAVPLNVLCILPAAVVFCICGKLFFQKRTPAAFVFFCCLMFIVFYRPIIKPFGIFYKYKTHRLNTEMPQPVKKLLECLNECTLNNARILVEDSESFTADSGEFMPEAYYGTHIPGLFPFYVKRQYLCGPRPMYPIKHSFAGFYDGILFEKPVSSFNFNELKRYFSLFNIKWIVCWNEQSKALFDRFPGYITKIQQIDKFSIYEVNRKPSFFIKGSGTIEVGYNRLQLKNIIPEEEEIIIAYHWLDNLKATPEAKIERIFLGDDPVGFIKIISPPESLVLENKY